MPFERIKLIFNCLNPSLIICDETTAGNTAAFPAGIPIIQYNTVIRKKIDEKILSGIRGHIKTTDI